MGSTKNGSHKGPNRTPSMRRAPSRCQKLAYRRSGGGEGGSAEPPKLVEAEEPGGVADDHGAQLLGGEAALEQHLDEHPQPLGRRRMVELAEVRAEHAVLDPDLADGLGHALEIHALP